MKKICKNLTFWVLISIFLGVLLGHFYPSQALELEIFGKWFIEVIKLFIIPIVFLTISLGIVHAGDLKQTGKIGLKSIVYFEVVTTLALLIGVLVAYIIEPGMGVMPPMKLDSKIIQYQNQSKDYSLITFFKNNLVLQIVLLAMIVGVVLNKFKSNTNVVKYLEIVNHYVFICLKYFMYLAPLATFSSMAFAIAKFGLHSLIPLFKLMSCVYITMAIFVFLVLNLILNYFKINLLSFLKYIKQELVLVLGTSSSESALPTLMQKLQKLGCSKSVVGIVVPAGYSFNLDGTTIYLSMATLFLAQVYHVKLSIEQLITIFGVLMVTSKGAAGVTGAGFIVLASTLSAIKVIPVEGMMLLLGVDRFMSEARSITNFIGNGVATLCIAKHCNELDEKVLYEELG